MTEEEKPEEELKEKVEELAEGKQTVTPSDLDVSEAEKRTAKLKADNDALEEQMKRTEELRAKQLLGGRADAGTPEKTAEEQANEEAADILKEF